MKSSIRPRAKAVAVAYVALITVGVVALVEVQCRYQHRPVDYEFIDGDTTTIITGPYSTESTTQIPE